MSKNIVTLKSGSEVTQHCKRRANLVQWGQQCSRFVTEGRQPHA